MRRAAIVLGGVIALVAAGAGVRWLLWPDAPSGLGTPLRGANLLLITIDTLRPDRLGAYGGRDGLTPTLDALARRGALFTHAWSHAPITLPAHASILTGLIPPHHGVHNNGSFRLGSEPPTLAERLRSAGYRTAGFVGAFVLDARFGLNRGFEEYDDQLTDARQAPTFHFVERPADVVLRRATAWIARAGSTQPWFAWVHLFDPHAPYQAPESHRRGRTPYDAEVAWTDAALGAALKDLENRGQLSRTVIVVTADHGESLGDHGETTHGLFAYDATLRVPLIIAGPGIEAREVATRAGHVDILPTLLDLLGIEPPAIVDGSSRRPDLAGTVSASNAVYFEALDANLTRGWAPLSGVVDDGWKYIQLPQEELYDLTADPYEQTNVADREPGRVRALRSRLREWTTREGVAISRAVDSSEAARLRSLGYLSGSATPRNTYQEADDPKRLVAISETFNTALDDASGGRGDAALKKFTEVLARRPDFLAARLSAATLLIASNRSPIAIPLLQAAPPGDKTRSSWQAKMGQALAASGRLDAARSMLASAVDSARGDPEPLNDLGVVLLRLGRRDEARRAFEQLLQIDPTASGTWFNLGLLEMDARRPAAAAVAFQRVVDLDPRHADAWRGLGAALVTSDQARAADAWRKAVELEPRDADTQHNLRLLLEEMKRR
jgi:arylsulfatase A-like enzyme/Flp pilus assembly protein TadD